MEFRKSYAFIDICARVDKALRDGNREDLGNTLAGLTRGNIIIVMQAVAGANKGKK